MSNEAPREVVEMGNNERRVEYVPTGFTSVEQLNHAYDTKHPETIADYESKGLTPPEPGEYAQNNGTLVAVDADGRVFSMLPIKDATRAQGRFDEAIRSLEELGYKKSSFNVPFS